jgi:hypothetical protein
VGNQVCIVTAAVQDPNRARRSAANALTTKSSAAAIASKLSRLLEEDKNIKQVTYDWAGLHCAVLGRSSRCGIV